MIAELILSSALAFVGSLVVNFNRKIFPRSLSRALAALPTGLALSVSSIGICLGLGMGFQPFGTVGLAAFLLVVISVRNKDSESRKHLLKEVVFGQIVTATVVAVMASTIQPILTNDSYLLIEYGRWLDGEYFSLGTRFYSDWPLTVMHLQAWAPRVGAEFIVSTVSGAGLLGVLTGFSLLVNPRREQWGVVVLVGSVVGIVCSATFMLRSQIGLLNSHLICAGYLCMLLSLGDRRGAKNGEDRQVGVFSLLLAALVFTRMEGFLLLLLVLAFAGARWPYNRKEALQVTIVGIGIPAPYFIHLVFAEEPGSILSPSKILVLVGVNLLFLITAFGFASSRFEKVPPWFVLFALPCVAYGVYLFRSSQAKESASALLENALLTGNWGIIWWGLIPLAVVATVYGSKQVGKSAWVSFIFAFVSTICLMGAVRQFPFRSGWGDSANRMLVHLAPVVGLYIAKVCFWNGSNGKNDFVELASDSGVSPVKVGRYEED